MRWAGHAACTGENVCRVMTGTLEGNRPFARLKCRSEDTIKIHLEATERESVHIIHAHTA
jgi:hypothetical protein